ncbi:MAG: hypothetical protein ACE5JK_08365, partial [Candidatus Omnitrophota bacterium]
KGELSKGKKVVKIDLAASDVFCAYFHEREIKSLARPYRTKIRGDGYMYIPGYDEDGMNIELTLKIPRANLKGRNLIGKEAVILVEDDKNHGQVINVYLAKDYDSGKKDRPLVTYKYYEKSAYVRAAAVDLNGWT